MRKHYPSESNPVICENWEEASERVFPRKNPGAEEENRGIYAGTMAKCWRRIYRITENVIVFPKEIFRRIRGKKMPANVYEKARQTMFRKGNIPANHKPIGYERINVDGYVEVKVAEPNKFRLKHRIVWEEKFRDYSTGYNVQFGTKIGRICNRIIYI